MRAEHPCIFNHTLNTASKLIHVIGYSRIFYKGYKNVTENIAQVSNAQLGMDIEETTYQHVENVT